MSAEVSRMFPDATNSSSDLCKSYGILENAALDQLGLILEGRFDNFQDKENIDLLDTLAYDPAYFDLIGLARTEVGYYEEDRTFKRNLAGALFEELALAHMASRLDLGGVVVSGDELFQAMMALNQGREIIEDSFGHRGIYGRYIPDGLLIGEIDGKLSVQGVLEISLGKWSEKLNKDKQIRGYNYLIDGLGIAKAQKPPLIVVTPRFDSPDNGYNGVRHITVPVEKRVFLDELFNFAYYKDMSLDGFTLNQARQIYRRTGEVIANPASI